MSGVPILYQSTFIINSYYCEYTNTNNITYYLDVDNEYINKVNRIAVTKIYIPNKIYQFEDSDFFTLVEGSFTTQIFIGFKTYDDYVSMASDLQLLLNNKSPNGYIYTVAIIPNTNNTMNISCSDTTTIKQIIINNKHLELAYGINGIAKFTSFYMTKMMTLSPIDIIFVNSNAVLNYNTNTISASILTVFDLHGQSMQQNDILSASKAFNSVKKLQFILTDFDNDIVNLEGNKHWWMEMQLFYYNEDYIEKQKIYIDLRTFDIMKQKEIQKLNDEKKDYKEEEKNMEIIQNQS